MTKKEVCYWSIGDGECAFMLQTLIHSFYQVGMEGDFHVFSDREINGAITHLVGPFDKRGFFFKFAFLQSEIKNWDYRYFIYLDSDCLFVRKPPSLLEFVHHSPVHFFLEGDCLAPSKRKEWWNCPLPEYVALMRDCGVNQEKIYTLNSGLFILRKDIIEVACNLAQDFFEYALSKGYYFPDEPLWAYAMHMLCDIPEKHLLKFHRDVWGTDWAGEWKDKLPSGDPWTFYDYLTEKPFLVNPAIVHALRSKRLLIESGQK